MGLQFKKHNIIFLLVEKVMLMKIKKLIQIEGIIGIITGLLLIILYIISRIFWPLIFALSSYVFDGEEGFFVILGIISNVYSILSVGILILGVLSLFYYFKNDKRISLAPSILFIVGSVVALIPFLGWIGGIVLVIGGALYLASLKQFKIEG